MNKFPGIVTWHQHGKLLLNPRIVRISVLLHATKEIVLDCQRVRFANKYNIRKKNL